MHTNYTFGNPIVLSVKVNLLLLFSELTVIDFVVKRLAFFDSYSKFKKTAVNVSIPSFELRYSTCAYEYNLLFDG